MVICLRPPRSRACASALRPPVLLMTEQLVVRHGLGVLASLFVPADRCLRRTTSSRPAAHSYRASGAKDCDCISRGSWHRSLVGSPSLMVNALRLFLSGPPAILPSFAARWLFEYNHQAECAPLRQCRHLPVVPSYGLCETSSKYPLLASTGVLAEYSHPFDKMTHSVVPR